MRNRKITADTIDVYFIERINTICKKKNWGKDWLAGGCYLHLEVSEFIESLRGKGKDSPASEAADVLFALFAMMAEYRISFEEVLKQLDRSMLEQELNNECQTQENQPT
jgi:NTP pyrophosphatase (non-canonical NTP hydrolase)